MGGGIEDNAIDSDDYISRPDPCRIRTRSGHDLPHDTSTRHVHLKNDAIVRARKEHIRDRESGNQEREDPGRQR